MRKKTDIGEIIMQKGIEYLKRKLSQKKARADRRYEYYEMKNYVPDVDPSMPTDIKAMVSVLGWCGAAVDNLADRLVFRMFRNDDVGANELFDANNSDILLDSAILGALITSCDFAYVYESESGLPRLQIVDGCDATGVMDLSTHLLTEGYAVLERDQEKKTPILEAYFTPESTTYIRQGAEESVIPSKGGVTQLVPIVHRPDARREFGRSRISRACMSYQNGALQAVRKSEIAAYFYSYPQRYALGFEQDDGFNKWRAAMSAMMTMGRDDQGNIPQVGQFPQQSMTPYNDHLRMFAGLFAGETGLTLEDMGFPLANPSSPEAIKAAHEVLRLKARKAQRGFSSSFMNIAYTAICVRDALHYDRDIISGIKPVWEPIFEPSASQYGAIGDAIFKINQASEGYIGPNTIYDMTGLAPEGGTADGGNSGRNTGALEGYLGDVPGANEEG